MAEKNINKNIGKTFYEFRAEFNYSREEMSAAMDISYQKLARIETGKTPVTLEMLILFIEMLGVSPTRFFKHLQYIREKEND